MIFLAFDFLFRQTNLVFMGYIIQYLTIFCNRIFIGKISYFCYHYSMENFLLTLIDPSNQVYQLLIALFLGTFIGLRREMIFQKEKIQGIMGVRTISIFVILGTISTFFKEFPYLPLYTFSGVFIFLVIAYYNGVFNLKKIGLTSELSALIMF